jgi:signal transduction histidine kinase
VIFITALSEVGDETRGFSLGAVDYITKPIQPAVVQARVKTHLEMKLNREKLEKQNHELLEAAKLREEVERITRHDLKSPLDTIIGFPELILMQGNLDEEQAENLRLIEEAGRRMLTMINRSLDLFKMEQKFYRFEPQEVNVLKIIRKIYREHTHGFGLKEITPVLTLEGKEADTETFPVWAEELLCYSMLENLIRNALEASPEGKPLSVNISSKPQNTACIAIHNYGVVPAEIRGHFFEKYVTYGKEAGTGLGTYSARLMAETQEGKISFTTHEEQGTTVFVTLRR